MLVPDNNNPLIGRGWLPLNKAGRIALITTLAGLALACLSIGILRILPSHAFLTSLPPAAAGILIGVGGAVLTGDIIWSLLIHCPRRRPELLPPPPIEEDPALPLPPPEAALPPPSQPALNPPPPPRTALGQGMQVFKSFDPELAARYGAGGKVSEFLETLLPLFPAQYRKAVKHLIDNQRAIELDTPESLALIQEKANRGEKLFFLGLDHTTTPSTYSLVKWENREDLPAFLAALRLNLTDKTPLPEGAVVVSAVETLKKVFSSFLTTYFDLKDKAARKIVEKSYQLNLLKKIVQDYPEWQTDLDLFAWVRTSLAYLTKGLNALSPSSLSLQKELAEIRSQIAILQTSILEKAPPGPSPLAEVREINPLTAEKIVISPSSLFPGVKRRERAAGEEALIEKVAVPPLPLNFSDPNWLEQVKAWHDYFFALPRRTPKQAEKIEREITDFFLTFPKFEKIPEGYLKLEETAQTERLSFLFQLAHLGMSLHVVCGRLVMHPSRFLSCLKIIEWTYHLVVSQESYPTADPLGSPEAFIGAFAEALADPYFDLGPYAASIHSIMKAMNIKREEKKKEDKKAEDTPLTPICQAFQSWVRLAQTFALPHRLLLPTDKEIPKDKFAQALNMLKEQLKLASQSLLEEGAPLLKVEGGVLFPLKVPCSLYLPTFRREIARAAYRDWDPGGFKYEVERGDVEEISLPYNYLHWVTALGPPVSPYLHREFRNPDIGQILVEGVVTSNTWGYANEDGSAPKSSSLRKSFMQAYPMTGSKETATGKREEKKVFKSLSIQVSRELQRCAAGRDNRAFQAIYVFSTHPELLLHATIGEDCQRFFRLALFKGDLLLRELEANPQMSSHLLERLNSLFSLFEKRKDYEGWLFLYRLHLDLLANLQETFPTLYKSRLEIQKGYQATFRKLLSLLPKPVQMTWHMTRVYEQAVGGAQEFDVETAQSLLLIYPYIQHKMLKDPLEGQLLQDFGERFIPTLVKAIEESPDLKLLDEVLALRLKGGTKAREWVRLEAGVYRSKNILVNLHHLGVEVDSQVKGLLPIEIREQALYKELWGEAILQKVHTLTYVETAYGPAWYIGFEKEGTAYSLYLAAADSRFPLLYRKRPAKEWEQLLRIETCSTVLPFDLKEGFLWSQGAETIIENARGKPLYRLSLEEKRLSGVVRFNKEGEEEVLALSAPVFSRLDTSDGFIATRTRGGQPVVHYLRDPQSYRWNPVRKRWESLAHEGYFLSEKTVDVWIQSSTLFPQKNPFFSSVFTGYHLLENETGSQGKLVLPCRSFSRRTSPDLMPDAVFKYSLKTYLESGETGDKTPFCIYEIEKNGLLKTKKPQDFLYLAYALFSQGKYGTALLFLQQSQAVWTAANPKICMFRDKIAAWIKNWPDRSPNGQAFKMHVLLQEHRLREACFPSADKLLFWDEKYLSDLMFFATNYFDNEKEVDLALRLGRKEKEELQFLAPRALAWVKEYLDRDTPLLTKEAIHLLKTTASARERLSWALQTQQDFYLAHMPLEKEKPLDPDSLNKVFFPIPLVDVSTWLVPVLEAHRAVKEKIDQLTGELTALFSGKELADEIGIELVKDLKQYADKVERTLGLAPGADLEAIVRCLASQENKLAVEEKRLKERILNQFLIPETTPFSREVERHLLEREALLDTCFNEARHAFGVGNFDSLIEKKVLAPGQESTLRELLRAYEIARGDRKLLVRKRESTQQLMKEPGNTTLREECGDLLQQWRVYDPFKHPYAPILLLLEDELNIMSRPSQMVHIDKLINHPDAYIHEAMAGGKTTFLRNVFSAIQQQRGKLAGVFTYAPLMTEHHAVYAHVNQLALGSTAFPLSFNRNSPRDEAALQLMVIYHLKALNYGGRIDQTPQSVLSLEHTLTEMICLLLHCDKETIEAYKPALNALQSLLKIRKDKLAVYSDEIDKIFNPLLHHNFSRGEAKILQRDLYKPLLDLITLIKLNPSLAELKEAIEKNRLPQMPAEVFERLLETLASEAYTYYKLPFEKEMTIAYMTEKDQAEATKQAKVIEFYQGVILTHKDADVRLITQILHALIGVLLRDKKNKMVGCDFGFSKDKIAVKPYSFSAVCQESSQRSFVLSTLLEVCLTYMVEGVSVEGVKVYIEKMKGYATQQIQEMGVASLSATETGKLFLERFGVLLEEIKEEHYLLVATKMRENCPLFLECLEEIVLKDFTYFEEKIEGHSHSLPDMVTQFMGASGSPERVYTLPPAIKKLPALMRQEGAIGSVFYALLKEFNDKTDFVISKEDMPIERQIGQLLTKGDTLIDNAPFFPGKRGIEMVEALAKSSGQTLFRYLDESDSVAIWNGGHPGREEGLNLAQVISIIPHKGRQGTNWAFAKGTKGVVEAAVTTSLTDFYQSLMRLRLLGKGQRAVVFCEHSLAKQWAKLPEPVKESSSLAKLIWSLCHQEAEYIQVLNFQANRKALVSTRLAGLQTIKREIKNPAALATLARCTHFKLTTTQPLNPAQFGAPVKLGKASENLEHLLKSEQKALQDLIEEIEALEENEALTSEVKVQVKEILSSCEARMKSDLILDAKFLPSRVSSGLDEGDATEEIEIEIEVDGEHEVQQELSLEVVAEDTLLQEQEQEIQQLPVKLYPPPMKMLEDSVHSLEKGYIPDITSKDFKTSRSFVYFPYKLEDETAWWHLLDPNFNRRELGIPDLRAAATMYGEVYSKKSLLDEACQRVMLEEMPNIWISCLALGVCGGFPGAWPPIDTTHSGKKEIPEISLWIHGLKNKAQLICSSVLVFIPKTLSPDKKGQLYCQVASEMEVNRNFDEALRESQKDTVYPSILHKDTKYPYILYKTDLRETAIPTTLPTALRQEWIEKIALAKFLYVESKFSGEELAYLKTWLNSYPDKKSLLARLTYYLNHCCPDSARSHLLIKLLGSL